MDLSPSKIFILQWILNNMFQHNPVIRTTIKYRWQEANIGLADPFLEEMLLFPVRD